MVFKRWRHLFTFVGSLAVLEVAISILYEGFCPAPPLRRDHDRALARLLAPGRAGGDRDRSSSSAIAYIARRRRPASNDRQDRVGRRGGARLRGFAALPRHVPPLRHAGRRRASPSAIAVNAFRFFTPNEVFPVTLRRREDRAPRRRRAARRGGAAGGPGSTRAHGARHQAGRARRLGRLDAAAAPRRGRSRHLPVREALRHEPRAGRPLVQARPHDPLRAARGRGAVPDRSGGSSSTRTTRCASCATSAFRRRRRTASSR